MNGAACRQGDSIACNMYSKRQGSYATFDTTDTTTTTTTTTIIYSSTNDDTKEKRKLYTIQQEEVLLSTEITSGLNESDDRTRVYKS